MNSMRFPRSAWFWVVYVIAALVIWYITEVWWVGLIGGFLVMFVLWILFVILAKLF